MSPENAASIVRRARATRLRARGTGHVMERQHLAANGTLERCWALGELAPLLDRRIDSSLGSE